jgi:hypothetical protein
MARASLLEAGAICRSLPSRHSTWSEQRSSQSRLARSRVNSEHGVTRDKGTDVNVLPRGLEAPAEKAVRRWQLSSCSANASISVDTFSIARSTGASPAILSESTCVFALRISGSALCTGSTPCGTVMFALNQKAADLIDHVGPLAHKARAHAMQSEHVHLFQNFGSPRSAWCPSPRLDKLGLFSVRKIRVAG